MRKPPLNLEEINQRLTQYTYSGYDLHFMHGWFIAYLLAPRESDQDVLIPIELIIDDSKVTNEQDFAKLIDDLILVYSELSAALYEQNKAIQPLIDLTDPTFFPTDKSDRQQMQNLLSWLYGYLDGYITFGYEVDDYVIPQKLLDEKFYPALFTLCIGLFVLSSDLDQTYLSEHARNELHELIIDLQGMWESDSGDDIDAQSINEAMKNLNILDISIAINDLFHLIRLNDEKKYATTNPSELLNKLTDKKVN